MPLIRETIVTTVSAAGRPHIAPLGVIADREGWIIAPFRPSTTLDNLSAVPFAVLNHVDDVRVFAGCLTGRRAWPLVSENGPVPRLAACAAHEELAVMHVQDDPQRPRFHCRVQSRVAHSPFAGHNRAKAAVIEACILASRLHMLPREKIASEMAYLQIAISKTAGPEEEEAWSWIKAKIDDHFAAIET
jgi:uncharacterized protein